MQTPFEKKLKDQTQTVLLLLTGTIIIHFYSVWMSWTYVAAHDNETLTSLSHYFFINLKPWSIKISKHSLQKYQSEVMWPDDMQVTNQINRSLTPMRHDRCASSSLSSSSCQGRCCWWRQWWGRHHHMHFKCLRKAQDTVSDSLISLFTRATNWAFIIISF